MSVHHGMSVQDVVCRAKTRADVQSARKEEVDRVDVYDEDNKEWVPLRSTEVLKKYLKKDAKVKIDMVNRLITRTHNCTLSTRFSALCIRVYESGACM